MAFDLLEMRNVIKVIDPEYVWIGYNTKKNFNQLAYPEPSFDEVNLLVLALQDDGIPVKIKHIPTQGQ
jgi:hypothetical protein